jgi:hypothetical protein
MTLENAMQTPSLPFARRLRRDQFLHFPRPRRLCLRAERGTLWITIDGELDDIELAPGRSRVFDGHAQLIVGSLRGDAVLSAQRLAAPPRWHQLLHHRLHALLAPALSALARG